MPGITKKPFASCWTKQTSNKKASCILHDIGGRNVLKSICQVLGFAEPGFVVLFDICIVPCSDLIDVQ
jgi:hypothetical protein